ncbi:hypothetical protein GCM10020256_36970 [Streptomyces thermocoprophilus]
MATTPPTGCGTPPASPPPRLPPTPAPSWAAAWPPADATPVPFDEAYDQLADAGYDYGPAFRAVRAVWRRDDVLFAEVALPDGLTADGYGLHPVLLDAALHPFVAGSDELRLPFAFQDVTLTATGATALRVRLTPDGADGLAVDAADEAGQAVLSAGRLHVRAVPAASLAEPADRATHLYRLGWEEFPAQDAPLEAWAAVGAPAAGLPVHAGLDELADTLGGRLDGAVLTCPDGDAVQPAVAVLEAVQRWLSDDRFDGARLVLLTRGAVPAAPGEDADVAQAAIWGLVRTAQAENPGRFTLIDTDGADDAALRRALSCGEPQLAVRAGTLRVPRLTRAAADDALVPPADVPAWRLAASGDGTLDGLSLVPYEEALRPLAEGEVRLGIRAAGLNFRDVVVALGMVESPHGLGWEASGVVLETGPGVTGFAVGDRVMGLVPGSYGPTAVADSRTLAHIPQGWTFAQAASVPAVFLTAYYALVELAGLKAGESVLIHAATGGVGMAAVQLARHLGAEVYATASRPKWPTLRAMGFDDTHIASSRDLDFEKHILDVTGGKGVDVVLDSLAGEFVDASLRALGDSGGRFVEMGKTDIRDADEVAARHPGVTYRAFDLPEAGPELIGRMLDACLELFEAGVLTPLPLTAWDIRHAPRSLPPRQPGPPHRQGRPHPPPTHRPPHGTALITGATGTLGRLVARHLVTHHHIRHLLLTGRRGLDADGMPELVTELENHGATVTVEALDITDHHTLTTLLDNLTHPLTLVVHTAGLLDDGILAQQTPDRLHHVWQPKTHAAHHLHHLTTHHDLAHFVLFSSIAGTLGNAGQANYAAANAALDALAHHRHHQGLPALSLAWGLWAPESAMTAGLSAADRARLASAAGTVALEAEEGLRMLDAALEGADPAVVASHWDLAALRARAAQGTELAAPLRGLVRAPRRVAAAAGPAGAERALAARLTGLTGDAARQAVRDTVNAQVAAVLGHGPDTAVDGELSFKELGFDSLTSVELRNRLAAATELKLSTTIVFDFPTPLELADHLYGRLAGDSAERPAAEPAQVRPTAEAVADDAVAIVSMGCRYPGGAGSPEELWRVLADGVDTLGDFPDGPGLGSGVAVRLGRFRDDVCAARRIPLRHRRVRRVVLRDQLP